LLVDAHGGIVDRDTIVEVIWGGSEGVTEQAIDALVRRLRRRLNEADPDREFIVTVRGYGFRLDL
jgi:DNA-binding response OmpR family regulator